MLCDVYPLTSAIALSIPITILLPERFFLAYFRTLFVPSDFGLVPQTSIDRISLLFSFRIRALSRNYLLFKGPIVSN